jgi:hypothetical protein
MWAAGLGMAARRPSGPGMMGTRTTDRVGAGTAIEECGR